MLLTHDAEGYPFAAFNMGPSWNRAVIEALSNGCIVTYLLGSGGRRGRCGWRGGGERSPTDLRSGNETVRPSRSYAGRYERSAIPIDISPRCGRVAQMSGMLNTGWSWRFEGEVENGSEPRKGGDGGEDAFE